VVRVLLHMQLFCLALIVSATATASDREADILSAGVLRVCIWPDYYSITYRDPHSGLLGGIDIDMAEAFAESLGVAVDFVDSSFALLVENLLQDRCDIAMHGVGVRADRARDLDFSHPYLISDIYAVKDAANDDITAWSDIDRVGNIVVVQKGTYMEPVMQEYLTQAQLTVVDDFIAREQEVQSGRADVFMTDYPYGIKMARLSGWAELISPDQPLVQTPYAYAVSKGQPSWLNRIDRFLEEVSRDGRLVASAQRHGLMPALNLRPANE